MRILCTAAFAALGAAVGGQAWAQAPAAAIKTNPEWLKKPNLNDIVAAYPREASDRRVGGKAVILCKVNTQGLLHSCDVTSEDPKGFGFGAAALALAPTMLMKPATENGKPVESAVTVPINFAMGAPGTGPIGGVPTTVTVLPEMIWNRTPSVPEILAEIDKKVGDKYAEGKVVFQCEVSKSSGKLSNCNLVNASPGMEKFKDVAHSLTRDFEGDTTALKNFKNAVKVNLAFSFPDMQSDAWSQRYLTRPRWVRTISPDPNKATFPEAAIKAGLKTGSAVVDCVLDAKGALTQCRTVSESTPGVGFGDMARAIAEVFVANPWTDEGLPADGAHVRMPVRMDYEPPPAAAAAPTPATKP